MYTEASGHTELNKDQDEVATADPKGPEDMDLDSIFIPEVPEDNEVLGDRDREE